MSSHDHLLCVAEGIVVCGREVVCVKRVKPT